MKVENTIANKAKFFGNYLDQKCLSIDDRITYLNGSRITWRYDVQHGHLELTPLSMITDEDAIEVARLIHEQDGSWDKIVDMFKGKPTDNWPFELDSITKHQYDNDIDGKYYHTDVNTVGRIVSKVRIYDDGDIQVYDENGNDYDSFDTSTIRFLNATDYLRSKGYALPWMGLSVEELQKRGWIKLREL